MKRSLLALALVWLMLGTACTDDKTSYITLGFEDITLPEAGYWNGSDGSGGFTAEGVTFPNSYNATYGSWSGFAVSKLNDVETAGYSNQYSAFTTATGNFLVAYASGTSAVISFSKPHQLSSVEVVNGSYPALSMRDGDSFSKKFGGADGLDPDWFKLTVTGLSANEEIIGSVSFYLADFRADGTANDYILNRWTTLDLSAIGEVSKLQFSLSSSDVGDWGMNTPAYVCIDNLKFEE